MSAVATQRGIGAGVCARCGKSITHPGPDGECVRCLVSFGFLAEDDEVQRDSGQNQVRLAPLRYAHFEVEVNSDGFPVILGSGAMAVTYRARDTVLNSTVALKVIGRKLAEDPVARARFLREARAAAQIHHPNVARVTHYGEQDGECFYAMELVHGETPARSDARVQYVGFQFGKGSGMHLRFASAARECLIMKREILAASFPSLSGGRRSSLTDPFRQDEPRFRTAVATDRISILAQRNLEPGELCLLVISSQERYSFTRAYCRTKLAV